MAFGTENDDERDDAQPGAETAADERTPEERAPETVEVDLRGTKLVLPREQATVVQRAFDALDGRYGSELDRLRRAADRPIVRDERPARTEPAPTTTRKRELRLPNHDLILQNSQAWQQGLAETIDGLRDEFRGDTEALVRAAVDVMRDELDARDADARLQAIHDRLLNEHVYEKNPLLRNHSTWVDAVYEEVYPTIKHLPASRAFERLNEICSERIEELTGKRPDAAPAPRDKRAPGLVSSGGGRSTTPTRQEPARKTLSDLVQKRQDEMLGRRAA